MSRNLYKYIQELEKRIEVLEQDNRYLQNAVSHLDTLLRLQEMKPCNPTCPSTPWYRTDPNIVNPYKITCSTKDEQIKTLEEDPFVKLVLDSLM